MTGLSATGARPEAVNATMSRWLDRGLTAAVALAAFPRLVASPQSEDVAGAAPSALRRSVRCARNTPALSLSYGRAAHARLRSAEPCHAVVQIGTGYQIRSASPVITFEDMTIVQALECNYPDFISLSKRQRQLRIDLQRRVYESATACAVSTAWAAASLRDDYGVPAEKIHVTRIGANHRVHPPALKDWSRPRFLFVGRDWEGKNGPMTLRAFQRLRADHPNARLDIVGGHPTLDQAGVSGHGMLRLNDADERSRVEALYRTATCFMMPSCREAAGIAYAEAMHAGLPCIGTSVGGARDVIGGAGCTVDPRDEDQLLDAMRMFADPDTASRVGGFARDRAALFTWEAVGQTLLSALRPRG